MKRAIELTLRVIIILVMLLVGLIVVVVFFYGGFGAMTGGVSRVAHETGIGGEYATGGLLCFGEYKVTAACDHSCTKTACENDCTNKREGCECKARPRGASGASIKYYECVPLS